MLKFAPLEELELQALSIARHITQTQQRQAAQAEQDAEPDSESTESDENLLPSAKRKKRPSAKKVKKARREGNAPGMLQLFPFQAPSICFFLFCQRSPDTPIAEALV